MALPGEGHHPIATFDRIRTALGALAPDARDATDAAGTPASSEPVEPVEPPKRRWWQRRG
ncbi:hypothetical protein OG594_03930 [Streptomyces sp. NBC_01214]|uniref:hypothetical protein n=1 Tax=Streptomyces sp. NBC_01214 TaxID=2903777 RepID=UPI002256425C|nr:hypothetical protein [Streptomyces sp. NBC_01214]MCX4800815.1 hypothetical protein [Streptomyces sp. NBC_01214]